MKQVLNETDLDLNFLVNPITGDVSIKTGVDVIKQRMKNIILLGKHDIPFKVKSNSILTNLFENYDPIFNIELKRSIRIDIEKYEKNVRILNINTNFDESQNMLNISINFSVIQNDSVTELLVLKVERTR